MKNTGVVLAGLYVAVFCLAGYGWIMNIIKLVPMEGMLGMLMLRVAGIFLPPLGAVLGYIG